MIAVISDLHVHNHQLFGGQWDNGLNDRARAHLAALSNALEIVGMSSADTLIIAGDLFHVRTPDPAIVSRVNEMLSQWRFVTRIEVIVVKGNHDELETHGVGDHSLRYLDRGIQTVARGYSQNGHLVVLPFERGAATRYIERLPKVNEGLLVGHYGISWDDSSDWTRTAPDYLPAGWLAAKLREKGYRTAILGHEHVHRCKRLEGVELVQVGALGPWSFSDVGDEPFGSVTFWQAGKVKRATVPGPRFFRVDGKRLPEFTAPQMAYVRFGTAPPKQVAKRLERLGVRWEAPLTKLDPKVVEHDEPVGTALDVEAAIIAHVDDRADLSGKTAKRTKVRALKLWRETIG